VDQRRFLLTSLPVHMAAPFAVEVAQEAANARGCQLSQAALRPPRWPEHEVLIHRRDPDEARSVLEQRTQIARVRIGNPDGREAIVRWSRPRKCRASRRSVSSTATCCFRVCGSHPTKIMSSASFSGTL
jgi:hypothetical protein